jgi:acetyl esterase/lipase
MRVTRETMDKQLRLRGAIFRRLMSDQSEAQLRRRNRLLSALRPLLQRRRPSDIRVTEEWLTRPDGSRLRLLVSGPLEPQQNVAGVLWIHGGGYAIGSPDMEASAFSQLIGMSDCVVVSPSYRLSPEAPYPAALEDCYAALLWLRDNAARLGVRLDQLAVAGASAGGGLTAALTLYARDRAEVAVAFQMPIYPMIDDRSITESARENDAPVWDATTNKSAWKLYLGELYGTDNVPAYAAPARAEDYTGLPPTLTYVGDLEPFRDETIAYVENLRAVDVPVEFALFAGCWHGFDGIVPKAAVSVKAMQLRNRWFRHAIQNYFAEQPSGH